MCRACLRRLSSFVATWASWSGDNRIGGACPELDRKAPQSLQKMEQQAFAIRKPLEDIKKATDQLQEATQAAVSPDLRRFAWCNRH